MTAPNVSFKTELAYASGSVAPGTFNALGALEMFFSNLVTGVPAAVIALALSAMVSVQRQSLSGSACQDRIRIHMPT